MNRSRQLKGLGLYLGTIQYCACLFVGGALWLLTAMSTGFFWGDIASQAVASLLLLGVIAAESWWAHLPTFGNQARDYIFDFLSSAGIAIFGMLVVLGVLAWLPR